MPETALTRKLIDAGLRRTTPRSPPISVKDALTRGLSEARAITAMLKGLDDADEPTKRRVLSEALQRSCVLRDHLDAAERAAR